MKVKTYSHSIQMSFELGNDNQWQALPDTGIALGDGFFASKKGKLYHTCDSDLTKPRIGGVFDIKVGKEKMYVCQSCKAKMPKKAEMVVRLKKLPI